MKIFFISLAEPSADAWKKVENLWPDHHHIVNKRMAFVAKPGIGTASEIKHAIGISTEDDAPAGIVVPLESYSGVLAVTAVDWIAAAESQ